MAPSRSTQKQSAQAKLAESQEEVKGKPSVEAGVQVVNDGCEVSKDWERSNPCVLLGAQTYTEDGPIVDVVGNHTAYVVLQNGEEVGMPLADVQVFAPRPGARFWGENGYGLLGFRVFVRGVGACVAFSFDESTGLHRLLLLHRANSLATVDLCETPFRVLGPNQIPERAHTERIPPMCTSVDRIENLYISDRTRHELVRVSAESTSDTSATLSYDTVDPNGNGCQTIRITRDAFKDVRYEVRLRTNAETESDIKLAKTRHPLFMMGLRVSLPTSHDLRRIGIVRYYAPERDAYGLECYGDIEWHPRSAAWLSAPIYVAPLGDVRLPITIRTRHGNFDIFASPTHTVDRIRLVCQDIMGIDAHTIELFDEEFGLHLDSDDALDADLKLSDLFGEHKRELFVYVRRDDD